MEPSSAGGFLLFGGKTRNNDVLMVEYMLVIPYNVSKLVYKPNYYAAGKAVIGYSSVCLSAWTLKRSLTSMKPGEAMITAWDGCSLFPPCFGETLEAEYNSRDG